MPWIMSIIVHNLEENTAEKWRLAHAQLNSWTLLSGRLLHTDQPNLENWNYQLNKKKLN